MATKTIPELNAITTIDGNAVLPLDTGTQSFKITAANLAKALQALTYADVTAKVANFTVGAANFFNVVPIDSTAGVFNIQLPNPTLYAGSIVAFKDIAGFLSVYPVSVLPFGAELIEGLAGTYLLEADLGIWRFLSSGGNWYLV